MNTLAKPSQTVALVPSAPRSQVSSWYHARHLLQHHQLCTECRVMPVSSEVQPASPSVLREGETRQCWRTTCESSSWKRRDSGELNTRHPIFFVLDRIRIIDYSKTIITNTIMMHFTGLGKELCYSPRPLPFITPRVTCAHSMPSHRGGWLLLQE